MGPTTLEFEYMANPVELWISTFNEGKLREFKELFKDQPVEVFSASELRHYSSPPETGDSFYANADIKARALKALKPQTWVLADDSGLRARSSRARGASGHTLVPICW